MPREREIGGLIRLAPARREQRRLCRGDSVRVIAGLFLGQDGLCDGLVPHERVRVLLDALGAVVVMPESDVARTGRRPRRRGIFTRGFQT